MCAQPATGKASDLVQQWAGQADAGARTDDALAAAGSVLGEERWLRAEGAAKKMCKLGTWKMFKDFV